MKCRRHFLNPRPPRTNTAQTIKYAPLHTTCMDPVVVFMNPGVTWINPDVACIPWATWVQQ